MLISTLIIGFLEFFKALFSLFNVPPMPSQITDGLEWVTDNFGQVVELVRYILTPTVFNVFVVMAIAYITFDFAYALLMWVLRKIPFISVRE